MDSFLSQKFSADLRVSPLPVVYGMLLFSVLLGVIYATDETFPRVLPLALVLIFSGLLLLWVHTWKPAAVSWLTLIVLPLIIVWHIAWYRAPESLPLLIIPCLLATVFFRAPVAYGYTAVVTLVILGLRYMNVNAPLSGYGSLVIITLWMVQAVHWLLLRRIREVAEWVFARYASTNVQLEEARGQRAELLQMTQDLLKANQQMALLNERLNTAREVAEEAQRVKTAFVANVSHEFRTPLNIIFGLVDLLLDNPDVYGERLPARLMEDLEIVRRSSEYLSSMINDVLDLSQIDTGRLALHKERVDLADIIRKALEFVRPLIDRKKLIIEMEVPDTMPLVFCDRVRIRQVIVNMLSNAARYTDQGKITVIATYDEATVTIHVKDTGPGIAESELGMLFRPFTQAQSTRRKEGGGSGLGLSISKQFVELHGGRMWVESRLGEGSRFSFNLPVSPPLDLPASAASQIVDGWEWKQRTRPANLPVLESRPQFLLYDETGSLALVLRRFFDNIAWIEAENFEDVLGLATGQPAQGLLLNVLDADSLPQRVKMVAEKNDRLPVLALGYPRRAERALALGARGYLVKPAARADLQAAIAAQPGPVERILVVDDHQDEARLFVRMIESLGAQYAVSVAFSGQHALDLVAAQSFDLIFLDIVMPDMDGWQVLEAIRQGRSESPPVIFLSGNDPQSYPLTSPWMVLSQGRGFSFDSTLKMIEALAPVLFQRAESDFVERG